MATPKEFDIQIGDLARLKLTSEEKTTQELASMSFENLFSHSLTVATLRGRQGKTVQCIDIQGSQEPLLYTFTEFNEDGTPQMTRVMLLGNDDALEAKVIDEQLTSQ
jgi:hypothetical protein